MARPSHARIILVVLLVLWSPFISSQARLVNGFSGTPKKIKSLKIFRELGYDVSTSWNNPRKLQAETQRTAPGGPDPQHH